MISYQFLHLTIIQGYSKLSLLSCCKKNTGLFGNFSQKGGGVANCPAVFLSYFSLWICYEIQPAVVTPYTAVQNVWTISPARNHQFESSFWLKRLAIYM